MILSIQELSGTALSDAAVEDEVGAVAPGATPGSTSFVDGFFRSAPTVVGDDDAVASVLHRKRSALRATVYKFQYDLEKVTADDHLRIADFAATNESRHWNRAHDGLAQRVLTRVDAIGGDVRDTSRFTRPKDRPAPALASGRQAG